jgi:hypothetical protein
VWVQGMVWPYLQVEVVRLKGLGGGGEEKKPDPSQCQRWMIKWDFYGVHWSSVSLFHFPL